MQIRSSIFYHFIIYIHKVIYFSPILSVTWFIRFSKISMADQLPFGCLYRAKPVLLFACITINSV